MSKQIIINQRRPMASFAAPAYPTSYPIPAQGPPQAKPQQQTRPSYTSNPQWAQPLPPPPFAGAPPIPQNMAVNAQQWKAGYWQYNPAYNPAANSQAQYVPWIPSQQWMPQQQQQQQQQQQPRSQASQQAQQQQQASYNPYKRTPRPPSAEYLATKLSDNPLGLIDMVPAEVLYEKGTLPDDIKTPWIWNPRALDDVDEEDEDGNPIHYGHRNNTTSPVPSRRSTDPSPVDATPKQELKPTFSTGIIRTPDHYKKEASPSRVSSKGERSSLDSQLSGRMSHLSTGSSPFGSMSSAATSFTSISSASPTKRDFSPSPMLTDHISEEPASMLSPLVISATPKHLGPSPLRQQATHPVLAPIQESASDRRLEHVQPLGRADTMPNPPKTDHWRMPDRDRDRERDLRRECSSSSRRSKAPDVVENSYSYPTVLGTKHAVFIAPPGDQSRSSNSPASPSPHSAGSRPTPSPQPSRPGSRHSSAHASPTYPSGGSLNVTPPQRDAVSPRPSPPSGTGYGSGSTRPSPPSRHNSGSAASTSTASTVTAPYGHPTAVHTTSVPKNPLPDPPRWMHEQDYRQPEQLHYQTNPRTSSSSAQAPRMHPPPLPAPGLHPPKPKPIRKGFWNRRGDHLTQSGYIVYAPPHRTFPEELQNYPAEDEGYQDEKEVFSSYLPRRPELPESLPRMGKPPEKPYDYFVVYLNPEEAKRAIEAAREKATAPRGSRVGL